MNRLKTMVLGLLFSTAMLKSSAQNTSSTAENITKQDAVDFINKVINEFPATPSGDNSYKDFKETATLDGCNLIVNKSYLYTNYNGGLTGWQDSIVFNLAASSYNETETYSYIPGVLIHTQVEYKKNGKIDEKETEKDRKRGWDNTEPFTEGNIYVLLNTIDHDKDEFEKKDYVNRFSKAFTFLVKACGGTKKIEKKDKF